MVQQEIIIEVGVEGGSLCITHVRSSANRCAYEVILDESTLNEFLNDEDKMPTDDLHSTSLFATLDAAFAQFGKHPWHKFHLVRFSEPHRKRILEEAVRNGGSTVEMGRKMNAIAPRISKEKALSIVDNTAPIINEYLLGVKSDQPLFRQMIWRKTFEKASHTVDAEALLKDLIEKIADNIEQSPCRSLSNENWRKEVKDSLNTEKNKSDEVCFERKLAKYFKEHDLNNWWNQMPVASGLVGATSDRRRAVDLVHWDETTEAYDFIELKIDSDFPVYALMEIVLYGLIYLVSRDNPDYLSDKSRKSGVFQARQINLRVLAPEAYFEGYELGRFEQELNTGFQKILANRKDGLTMCVQSFSHPTVKKQSETQGSLDDLLNLGTWKRAFHS